MANSKTKLEVKTSSIDFSNSMEKIKSSSKIVNNEVVDTVYEVWIDIRKNGSEMTKVALDTVNETIEMATFDNGVKLAKKTAKNINTYGIETAEELIEGTMKGGKGWQKLFAKTLKGGVALYGQQQDMVLTALESLKGQYSNGTFRLKNLLSFDFKTAKATKTVAKKATAKVTKPVAKKVTTKVTKPVAKKATAKVTKPVAKKATAKATKPVAKKATAKVTKPVAKKATAKATKPVAKKATAKATKPVAKKATAKVTKPATKKVTAKAKAAVTKNNLRLIEGVGPKIEELLNRGGIYSFQQLAEAKSGTLKGILAAGGSRYKMHNPSTWSKQATLAAAGKREELKKLQAKLKGGKVVKK